MKELYNFDGALTIGNIGGVFVVHMRTEGDMVNMQCESKESAEALLSAIKRLVVYADTTEPQPATKSYEDLRRLCVHESPKASSPHFCVILHAIDGRCVFVSRGKSHCRFKDESDAWLFYKYILDFSKEQGRCSGEWAIEMRDCRKSKTGAVVARKSYMDDEA